MRTSRKLLSLFLCAVLCMSLLPTMAWAATYGDTQDHWAAEAIDRWSGYGVVNGKGEGTFDPDGQMTRAEAAQVFANLLGLNKEGDISAYPDAQGEWYSEAIAKCVAAGILNGKGAGKMDPNGTITREEFLTMYARAICISNGAEATEAKNELAQKGFADTAKVSDWAADSIGTLVEKGYVNGLTETELAPQANINRASVMALLHQSISTYVGKDSTETTVAAKSEGITLIANPAVTTVTGTADVVVVAAGAEQYNETTGEVTHNDIRVESAKMPVARVQGENITVTLALSTTADDATVTETGVDSVIVIESTAAVKNAAVAAEGAKIIVKDGAKAESVTVAETAKSATVETAKNATVGTVTIAAESATASVAGKVETVKVEETAKNATVETKSTAKVETVENKAENTAVTGTGTVGAVKSSEDVKVETKNTKVENTSETKDIAVTDSKGKESTVTTKTESTDTNKTETTVNTQPTGGGDSHSHTYSENWTYDETNHWHAATCGHDVVSGKAEHSYDETTHRCECGAFASDIVAAIGNQGYKTLNEAINAAATSGDTITMIQNVKQSNSIVVDKDVTLDLNGKTITDENWAGESPTKQAFFYVKSGGKLTVNDSVGTGKITTENENILAAIMVTIKDNNDAEKDAVLVVNGGTLCGYNYAIGANGNRHNTDITVNGGTLTASKADEAVSIYHPCKGKLTITGGTLEGYDGLAVKGGTVNITGGKFIATGDWSEAEAAQGSGANSVGAALYVEGNYGYEGTVNISGGEFIAEGNNGKAVYMAFNTEPRATISITGGTFSSDPKAYVAPGYGATKNDNETYTVEYLFAYKPDGTASAGTENDPFLIADAEQLENIRDIIDGGYCFKLVNNIDTTDKDWLPLGYGYYNKLPNGTVQLVLEKSRYFVGTFDGNNKTIKLKHHSDTANYSGGNLGDISLFETPWGAEIKNLTIDVDFDITAKGVAACGLAYQALGIFENITVNGKINSTSSSAGLVYAASWSQFKNCTNNADITVTYMYTNEEKTGDAYQLVGGIAGDVASGYEEYSEYDAVFDNCKNTGNLTNKTVTDRQPRSIMGAMYAQAINSTTTKVTLTNCSNTGVLTGYEASSHSPNAYPYPMFEGVKNSGGSTYTGNANVLKQLVGGYSAAGVSVDNVVYDKNTNIDALSINSSMVMFKPGLYPQSACRGAGIPQSAVSRIGMRQPRRVQQTDRLRPAPSGIRL